jgi:primosomal protein N' (replication factor Y)
LTPLVVRVLPDVPAIDKTFDYLVPDAVRDQVRVGDVVRIELHGRRVGGWVVAVGVDPPPGVALRSLAKRSGLGPPPELIELAAWAAERWVGRPASFLRTASPERVVAGLPPAPRSARPVPSHALLARAIEGPRTVLRVPPATNLVHVALAATSLGNALVLCPTMALVHRVAAGLRRAGVAVAVHPRDWAIGAAGATVVGTRAAAWAPVADLAAVVVLDEHDEAHQQEQAPTWHARDVAAERAMRAGVPCVLTSPCPTLEALAWGTLLPADRRRERAGWPPVEVVDRRDEDPRRAGLYSDALVRLVRSDARVLCVLNRTGRSRLLACAACGALARCDRCAAAVEQPDVELHCRRCGTTRPPVCQACGAGRFKNARVGVARAREELEALVGEPVTELTAALDAGAAASRVVVGTEAVLQRIDRADAVAFLDLDQELLAPRYRAGEQALGLLARAARVVAASGPGGDRAAGRLLLQTRCPDHEVIQAVVRADVSDVSEAEQTRRHLLRFPPFTALAEVSGAAAPAYVDALGRPPGLEVVPHADGRWLVRADDHDTLTRSLASVRRPPGRLRIEVDPLRV